MPADVRLMASVSAYVGDAALVSDVVEELGLRKSQAVVVGKALSKLGFTREMVRLDSQVYPLWIKKSCRYPKAALNDILRRRRLLEELLNGLYGRGGRKFGSGA